MIDFSKVLCGNERARIDIGKVNDIDSANLRVSAGTGMRWRSPLGPIRIDLARPVDADRSWRLHLSMGPDL